MRKRIGIYWWLLFGGIGLLTFSCGASRFTLSEKQMLKEQHAIQIAFEKGTFAQYNRKWGLLLRQHPTSYLCLYFFGLTLASDTMAWKVFDKAIALNPQFFWGYVARAAIYEKWLIWNRALADYMKALTLSKQFPEPFIGLGNIYLEKAKRSAALEMFSQALRLNPNEYRAYLGLGKLAYREGNFSGALNHLKKALSLHPKRFDIYWYMGASLERLNRIGGAIRHYEKCLNLAGNQRQVYFKLFALYKQTEQFGKALQIGEKIIQYEGLSDSIFLSIARIYERQKNYLAAVRFYLQYLQLNPETNHIKYRIAALYATAGNYEEAIIWYKKILRLDPKSKTFAQGMIDRILRQINCIPVAITGLSTEEILSKNRQVADACYYRERASGKAASGQIQLTLYFEADGQLSNIVVLKDTIGSKNLITCIKWGLLNSRFPISKTGLKEFTQEFFYQK